MWGTDLREALSCPSCNQLLRTPVTLNCGHTLSRSCLSLLRTVNPYSNRTSLAIVDRLDIDTLPSFYKCPVCSLTYDASTVACLKTNVLVQGLVNKVVNGRESPAASTATPKEISDTKKGHQSISSELLSPDARLRRRLSREYRRKGLVHLEESIAAFCIATFCETRNQSIGHVVGKVLHHMLSSKRPLRARCHSAGPYLHVPTETCPTSPVSDCEDASSGDEDLAQGVVGLTELRKIVERIAREVDRVRNTRSPPIRLRAIRSSDLECVLCGRCFLEPVTTSCGHTFCRACLERALDYAHSCPLCVAPVPRRDLARRSTAIVERALEIISPKEYDERLRARTEELEAFEKDTHVPVFVCTTTFPGVACPLYVYEPRYRLMTRRCLRSRSRRFAMTAPASRPDEKFARYGTMLEIRDVVSLHDGRSILSTVGTRRFAVVEKGERDGYDTASVKYVEDDPVALERVPDLYLLHDRVRRKAIAWLGTWTPGMGTEVERTLGAMPRVEPAWHSLPDGPSWAWWLLPILPLGTRLQVEILGTTSLEKRLRAIDKTLDRVNAHMRAVAANLRQSNGNEKMVGTCGVGTSRERRAMEL